jgi:hypothetical protein
LVLTSEITLKGRRIKRRKLKKKVGEKEKMKE